MRLLICQTPKLMYVQAVELLQRETAEWDCQMALLPEMALEHPPQCTSTGELSFDNIALLALSRFAKRRGIFVVLGSVEERTRDARVYDTCVVLNPEGEMVLQYRKQSPVGNKSAGTVPGIFHTEEGPVGVLLGAEVEEEARWAPLLAQSPHLILNPTRAPMLMDPVLAKAHPELQVVAWHRGFRALHHTVEARTRRYPCAFARADAPLEAGGAGTSLLFEPHRSVLAPSWSASFLALDTSAPDNLRALRLPGWRQLAVEERIRAAAHDRDILMDEEAERGPRYMVWTLQMPEIQARVLSRQDQHLVQSTLYPNLHVGPQQEHSFLVPLTAQDGRALYAVNTSRGTLTLWDVRLRREVQSLNMGKAQVTAASPGRISSQFVVAARTDTDLTFRVFDEAQPIRGIAIDINNLPWSQWPKAGRRLELDEGSAQEDEDVASSSGMGCVPEDVLAQRMGSAPTSSRRAHVRAVYLLDGPNVALAVIEAGLNRDRAPLALLVDLLQGTGEALDIYGNGPPPREKQQAEAEDPQGFRWGDQTLDESQPVDVEDLEASIPSSPSATTEEHLVAVHHVEQRFQERPGFPQRALVCLYSSNRLVAMTFGDWELHEQMLLEEGATRRQRSDVPVGCAVLPSLSTGSYHVVVSYRSTILRWWQVSLTQCRQIALLTYGCPLVHLGILELPASPPGVSLPGVAAAAAPPLTPTGQHAAGQHPPGPGPGGIGARRGTTVQLSPPRKTKASVAFGTVVTNRFPRAAALTPPPPSTGSTRAGSTANIAQPAPARRSTVVALPAAGAVLRPNSTSADSSSPDHSAATSPTPVPVAAVSAGELTVSLSASVLIAGVDDEGGMPIFVGRLGKITKIYTCSLDGARTAAWGSGMNVLAPAGLAGFGFATGPDGGLPGAEKQGAKRAGPACQLWCLEKALVCVLSCGDLRHVEFLIEDDVLALTDLSAESTV